MLKNGKSRKGSLYTIVSIGTSKKGENGNKKNNNNRDCSDGSVSHNNASYASFQAL